MNDFDARICRVKKALVLATPWRFTQTCRARWPVRVLRSAWKPREKETTMAWTTPILVEICIGLEINGYLPAEF
jgi:coenzyme PQQ precursor peptide PqqA